MRRRTPLEPALGIARVAAVVAILAWPLVTPAAGPFTVHRSTDPAEISSSPAYATTDRSSFEDAVGSLDDGFDYCYVVRDAWGGPVTIAVERNDALGTVRLLFGERLPGTDRDRAIARLRELTSDGGAFDTVIAGLDPAADRGAARIDDALAYALDALALLTAGDVALDAEAVGDELKRAVGELQAARSLPSDVDPEDIDGLIDELLDVARGLATYHIGVASQSCGACGSGGPAELCLAMDAVLNGDALRERESSNADLAAAVQYGQAVSWALEALAGCS